MNTIKTYTGAKSSWYGDGDGFEPTKAELGRRIHILEGILQAVIDKMGEKEGKEFGPMEIGTPDPLRKFTIYEAPKGEGKHIPE